MKLKGTVLIADGQRDSVGDEILKDGVDFHTPVPVFAGNDEKLGHIGCADLKWEGNELKAKVRILEPTAVEDRRRDQIVAMRRIRQFSGIAFYPSITGFILERNNDGAISKCVVNAISIDFSGNADKRIKGLENDADD